ncbi:MAG TPA: hypothetical protein PKI68_01060 [Pontiellaceae bacterium]|nr:hypothetical protein [Pontiellaceae bacterium]
MRLKSTKPSLGENSHPRFPDWESRLHDFANEVMEKPFVLGETNCSMLAARAVDVMYETDFFNEFRLVAPSDESELSEALSRRTLREFEAHGFSKVEKNFEQTGDVLIGWKEPFERCAVYLGGGRCLTSSREHGVRLVPLNVFVRAYEPEVFRWV